MEEKSYKNHIESAELAEGFSLDDILDEYRVPLPELPLEGESLTQRSKRIVMEAIDESGGEASIASIEDMVEELVS